MAKIIAIPGKLRIGFAGAGAISRYHLAGWAERDDAQVVAACAKTSRSPPIGWIISKRSA
ncbi:MAG TPA: hypothetical protein VF523_18835 [Burkholderiales bacterium]